MRQFCDKGHFARCIIDEREPGGLAAWINLEAEWFNHRRLHLALENDRERIAFEYGCYARREQYSCPARMDWVEWLLLSIEYKDLAHNEPPVARVKVASTRFVSGLT